MCRFMLAATILAVFCCSCATPHTSSQTQISVDEDPLGGGISSNDVRTMANQMTPTLLGLPEIGGSPDVVRIAISPMKNSSRFIIDMGIFMKRLRLELNRYSQGKVRFFSQGNAQVTRKSVLDGRNEAAIGASLNELAKSLLTSPTITAAVQPPKIAVVPVLNANLINMNADSFVAMLRSQIASQANGKIQFLMPGTVEGADYYLTGQFIAESMTSQGIVNLADYIGIVEARLREGKSLSVYDDDDGLGVNAKNNRGNQLIINSGVNRGPPILEQILTNSQLRSKPNVTKHLNAMLIKTDSKIIVYEKMITIEEKMTEGLDKSDYLLSGEITGLSKRRQGVETDYLLVTLQLVDPVSNELLWEDGYEVMKQSKSGIVYQ